MDTPFSAWPWTWWAVLVAMNVLSFFICCIVFFRSSRLVETSSEHYRKRMRTLGLVFVSVGLYRSVFVSSYYGQLAWFDSLANSSLIIRSFAFFAELSFAGLFMLAMLQFNKDIPAVKNPNRGWLMRFIHSYSPYAILACIFTAQFFATTALIFKIELFFAIEETLWGLAFLSVLPLALIQLRRAYAPNADVNSGKLKSLKIFATMNAAWCVIYCSYSVLYHLPIELWPHVIEQLNAGHFAMKSGWSAVSDALWIVNETKDYKVWGGLNFVIWHSGYFSISVWMVLFLMSGPRLRTAQ